MAITIKTANITEQDVDAIITSAGPDLLSDKDINSDVHQAAGPELAEYIKEHIPLNKFGNRLAVNEPHDETNYFGFHLTPGFNLPVKQIIHLMLPPGYDPVNRWLYYRDIWYVMGQIILRLIKDHNYKTVAISAIAWEAYGYDPNVIAKALLDDNIHEGIDMTICLPDDPEIQKIYQDGPEI